MSYQLHLAISDELERELRRYADNYGITLAAAVRVILHQALKEGQP